jgi:hypothetical protein
VLGAVALAIAAGAVGFRLWDRMVEDRLARWAVSELSSRTGGAYRLVLGDLSFLPLAGSIAFDSAVVVTDSARNRRRAEPLPGLAGRAHRCRVSGLDVVRLVVKKAFVARELGCERVTTGLALRPPEREKNPAAPDSADSGVSVEELARPLGLTAVEVGDIRFPALSLTLERPGADGGTSVLLEHARFEVRRLVFHPDARPGAGRTLSAERAHLSATGLVLRPDTLTEIAVAGAEAEFTDSTLRLAGAKHEPAIPERDWVREVRVRRDRIRFELDSLRARGVAFRAFAATGDIGIRALELSGARLDVLTDKRIPRGRPSRFRTPQQLAARAGSALRLDTVLVSGAIVYREREPERERPGQVTFDGLRGTVLDLHLPSRGRPLRISARARVMNAGTLAAEAVVPLDAPDFRYEITGTLGAMPAPAFNRFLSENEAFEFGEGVVDGIAFRQTARAGRAVTTVTPRYRELSVKPTGDGGGVLGSVKRAVKKFVANAFVVHDRNPDEDGEKLRTGRVVRRYLPTTTWLQFAWFGVRDGLMEALKE